VLDSASRYLETVGFDVVGRASRGDQALTEIETTRPVIALLDIRMEPFSGIEIARRAAVTTPETAVVLYTGLSDDGLLQDALQTGARGFVLKNSPLSVLAEALAVVAGGGTFIDPKLAGAVAAAGTAAPIPSLTKRERQILALVAAGMTNDRVGAELGISAETVQSHVRNAMVKLEADTRTQAVATAIRQALIA
jgi:DNA-binding NarL/FixJ family response regulator